MQHRRPHRPGAAATAALLAPALLVTALLVAACAGEPEDADTRGEGADTRDDGAGAESAPDDGAPDFERPEGWTESDSSSSAMRLHTYEKVTDAGRVELIVYAFDNAVGGLELNLGRWAQPRDPATLTEDELQELEVDPYVVTVLYLEADDEEQGPADVAHGSVGSGKFFAYIERPGAPRVWTVKASGPIEAMRAERATLEAFVQDL